MPLWGYAGKSGLGTPSLCGQREILPVARIGLAGGAAHPVRDRDVGVGVIRPPEDTPFRSQFLDLAAPPWYKRQVPVVTGGLRPCADPHAS